MITRSRCIGFSVAVVLPNADCRPPIAIIPPTIFLYVFKYNDRPNSVEIIKRWINNQRIVEQVI